MASGTSGSRASLNTKDHNHNIADILTKAASRETLERQKRTIGLRHVSAHSSQKELRFESIEHSHPMLSCALSSDQAQQFSCDKTRQVTKDTISVKGCGAEGYENRVLTLHEFGELTREIDESMSIETNCCETSATEVVICLWLASLCKGTRLQSKKV